MKSYAAGEVLGNLECLGPLSKVGDQRVCGGDVITIYGHSPESIDTMGFSAGYKCGRELWVAGYTFNMVANAAFSSTTVTHGQPTAWRKVKPKRQYHPSIHAEEAPLP